MLKRVEKKKNLDIWFKIQDYDYKIKLVQRFKWLSYK